MKKQTKLSLLLFLISLGCITPSVSADEWRIATLAPNGSAWMKILRRGAKSTSEVTAGRVQTKFFPGGVQGDEKNVVRKLSLGQLDGAALTSAGLSIIEGSIRVLELPRMFQSVEELDYVRSKMWPIFVKRFADKGYRLGEPGDVGFIYLYTKKRMTTLADLRSVTFWKGNDDAITSALFSKLGLKGVPMGIPKVLSALQTGRVDGCGNSPLGLLAVQWHTNVSFSTSKPISYATGASIVRLKKWKSLSSEDKMAMGKINTAQSAKLRKVVRKDNRKAKKALARSIQESPLDAEAEAAVTAAAESVWQSLAGKVYSKDDLKQVLAYRKEFRSK